MQVYMKCIDREPTFPSKDTKMRICLVQSKSRRQSLALVIPRFRIGHGAKDSRRGEGRETEMVNFGILLSILAHTVKIEIQWHVCSGVWQNSPGCQTYELACFLTNTNGNGASRGWVNLLPILFKDSIH